MISVRTKQTEGRRKEGREKERHKFDEIINSSELDGEHPISFMDGWIEQKEPCIQYSFQLRVRIYWGIHLDLTVDSSIQVRLL